jgi:CheY-like chemotaxis protein
MYLPRQGVLATAGATSTPTKPAPRGGRETILLADDEPMIRTLGRTILQRYGYHVLLAEDGVEAVEMYRNGQADISLVILDLTMPRLSGHDALHQLLQINPNVIVLLASGYSAEHLTEGHNERIAGFLSKPYRPEKLAQTVREALDRGSKPSTP